MLDLHQSDSERVQERLPVTREDLAALGIDLEQDHPGQTIENLRQYPVLSEGGWFMVIKDQKSLRCISRQPWRLLGPITLLSEGLELS